MLLFFSRLCECPLSSCTNHCNQLIPTTQRVRQCDGLFPVLYLSCTDLRAIVYREMMPCNVWFQSQQSLLTETSQICWEKWQRISASVFVVKFRTAGPEFQFYFTFWPFDMNSEKSIVVNRLCKCPLSSWNSLPSALWDSMQFVSESVQRATKYVSLWSWTITNTIRRRWERRFVMVAPSINVQTYSLT